ncbi:MAG: hypothetical protein GC185_04655 [Alphaproteobacteria bacterium]|nr:hypothetical protein [Alphaproteobacteria bacterium]
MSNLLETVAVSRRSGDDAGEILNAYLGTSPQMALNKTMEAAPEVSAQPKGTAAGDKLVEPR